MEIKCLNFNFNCLPSDFFLNIKYVFILIQNLLQIYHTHGSLY